MERLLSPAIRLASNQTVTRIRVTAFAPTGAVQCPSPQTKTSVNNLQTMRITIHLDVEIILYYSTVGIFHIFASKALRTAGVEKVVLIWTKHAISPVDIALDTLGVSSRRFHDRPGADPRRQYWLRCTHLRTRLDMHIRRRGSSRRCTFRYCLPALGLSTLVFANTYVVAAIHAIAYYSQQ